LHGDALDAVINNAKWLAKIGAIAYDLLIRVNQVMNWFRSLVGLPYWSVSAAIKRAVKSAVNYISGFEGALVQLAKQREVDGIICGHIHTPAVKQIDGIMYLNCGDWVESRSALVEKDGEIRMVYGK
jgi:UDP-2,3-diacylglucosamine pyrophosphatase LpxH